MSKIQGIFKIIRFNTSVRSKRNSARFASR